MVEYYCRRKVKTRLFIPCSTSSIYNQRSIRLQRLLWEVPSMSSFKYLWMLIDISQNYYYEQLFSISHNLLEVKLFSRLYVRDPELFLCNTSRPQYHRLTHSSKETVLNFLHYDCCLNQIISFANSGDQQTRVQAPQFILRRKKKITN